MGQPHISYSNHTFNAVSEISSHARPPEALLHEGSRVTLTLMSHLSVTTIKGGAPMPLRNYELEHDLIGRSLPSLAVQEAIFDQ